MDRSVAVKVVHPPVNALPDIRQTVTAGIFKEVPSAVDFLPAGHQAAVAVQIADSCPVITPSGFHNARTVKMIHASVNPLPAVSCGSAVFQIGPQGLSGVDPGYPARFIRRFDHLIKGICQSTVALKIVNIDLVTAQICHNGIGGERRAVEKSPEQALRIGNRRGEIAVRVKP